MSPFAFVPRAVTKYTKEWHGIARPPPSPSPPPDLSDDDDNGKGKVSTVEPKQPALAQDQDVASLISLALSDYNVWHDADLRWKLDACLQDDVSPDDAAFVPVNYLLRRAPFRGALPGHPEPSETQVVKSLRAHASPTLEVRMRLPLASTSSAVVAPVSSVWYGSGKTSRKKDVGGYEVRRKDWATLRDRPSRGWTRARWDELTAYIECVPHQYRTIGAIARFVHSLLSETGADTDAHANPRVQCVTLPLHYLDEPGDAPKCKGYALVTFSTKSQLSAILQAWPWKRLTPPDDNASSIVKEAAKYGLRAISKARWEALNEEYLAYRQALVDEATGAETEMECASLGQVPVSPQGRDQGQPLTQIQLDVETVPSSPYPFDCLVFVRNVHPDTNKTMLRSLFAQAFHDQDGSGTNPGPTAAVGIDYVDFNKGMDTCYLRLASPSHTTRLLAYFDANVKTQAHGLDATGRVPLADDKPIAMERVRGKKEELYWEKIPERVRRQAVERVVQAQLARCEVPSTDTTQGPSASGGKRKKRLREC